MRIIDEGSGNLSMDALSEAMRFADLAFFPNRIGFASLHLRGA
jgi:hypothetical protein